MEKPRQQRADHTNIKEDGAKEARKTIPFVVFLPQGDPRVASHGGAPMKLLWLTLVAGLTVVAFLSGGQEPGKATKQDPQEKFEPRGAPGAGQKYLQQYVGDFDVVKTLSFRGDPVRSTGTCKQHMVQDGRFLQSDFTFEGAGGKTTGMGLIGFESGTRLFTSIWIDSRQTKMSLRQSKTAFDGKEIVLHSRPLAEDGKAGRQSKTVTRLQDGGYKIVHQQYNQAADGTERVVMELVLIRKAAAPAGK
jgi:Protein of unknown function (DUF1579)